MHVRESQSADDAASEFQVALGFLTVDIDECLLPSSCAQLCTNTKGSFKCSCHEGFTQEGHQCRAQGGPARILYALGGKVEGLVLREDGLVRAELEMSSQEVVIKSFDYNPHSTILYWTSSTLGIDICSSLD